jgi:hypothetical protein
MSRRLQRVKKITKVEKLAKDAKDNARELATLAAKGAEDAAIELYRTSVLATHWLTCLYDGQPDMVTTIAQKQFSWPVMYGPHPDSAKGADALIKKLQVGAKTSLNLSPGKSFSWNTPANVVAFNLYQLARSLRGAPMRLWTARDSYRIAACGIGWDSFNSRGRRLEVHSIGGKYEKQLKALEAWGQRGAGKSLPPLSKETANQWATAIKELFKIAYPGNFEQHPKLQELKASVEGHAKTVSGKPGGAGIIRAAMLRKVKQACGVQSQHWTK